MFPLVRGLENPAVEPEPIPSLDLSCSTPLTPCVCACAPASPRVCAPVPAQEGDEDRLDQQMGDTGDQGDVVDEKLWGDDEQDEKNQVRLQAKF